MKKMHMMRIIGLIVVVTMLVMAVPVTAQTRFIELDPEEGAIGDTIDVVGEGFNKSTETSDKYAIMYFAREEASTVDDIDSDVTVYEIVRGLVDLDYNGDFTIDFEVPAKLNDGEDEDDFEDVTAGTYYVYVCHYFEGNPPVVSPIRAYAEFTVIGGEISIDPEEGVVGEEIEISGREYVDNENIAVFYDDDEIDIESGDDETDNSGDFDCTILIPESTAGAHTIKVEVGDSETEVEFTVESELVLDPTSGEAGAEVSVSGTGFERRSDVVVYFDAEEVIADTTDSDGSFEQIFTVPELEVGIYDVEAEDEDGNLDTAKFTIMVPGPTQPSPTTPTAPVPAPSPTAINISAESGKVGSDIVVTGVGFAAGGAVTIKFGDEVLDTKVADASGIFVAIVKVPSSKAGDHTITISDGTNANEVTFTVEAVPPPIPKPLLPEMGVEAKTPVTFDWEEVTADAGPVSYALQIATDDDFAEDSIVLDKTGLDESEYTTTEAESLALASRDAAYYWRVRSVDAAENEGEWTGAGEFYVSKPFSFPTWALYTLIAIGGLVLFAGGYLMGRRTAYYYTL
ncbi:MAG: IPT/TIG domain-containing protein [Dehalococcoidales bacterium]